MSKKNKSNQPNNEEQEQISSQISEELSEKQGQEESQQQEENEQQATPQEQTSAPFDLSQLSQEQLQQLKEMMNQTPDRIKTKKENPKVRLPIVNGKRVINFSKAYLRGVYDPERGGTRERQHIDIQFEGEKEMTTVLYRDFMQSPREEAEIVSIETQNDGGVVGETWSKEKQAPVEMRIDGKKEFFNLKTQDGKELKLSARLVNA